MTLWKSPKSEISPLFFPPLFFKYSSRIYQTCPNESPTQLTGTCKEPRPNTPSHHKQPPSLCVLFMLKFLMRIVTPSYCYVYWLKNQYYIKTIFFFTFFPPIHTPIELFLSCDHQGDHTHERERERERGGGGEKGRRNLSADLPPLVVIVFVRFKHSFLLFFFLLTFWFPFFFLQFFVPFSDEIKSSKSRSK